METINAIVRNTIDLQRANLIIRALSIAARNARRVRFDRCEGTMVRAIPEYPPAPPVSPRLEKEETVARVAQRSLPEAQVPSKPAARATRAHVDRAQAVNAHPQRE
jgi:hypothetical protein